MGYEIKGNRNVSRVERQRLGLYVVVGCFLFSMSFLSVTILVGFRLMNPVQFFQVAKETAGPQLSEIQMNIDTRAEKDSVSQSTSFIQQAKDDMDTKQPESQTKFDFSIEKDSSTHFSPSNQSEDATDFKQPESQKRFDLGNEKDSSSPFTSSNQLAKDDTDPKQTESQTKFDLRDQIDSSTQFTFPYQQAKNDSDSNQPESQTKFDLRDKKDSSTQFTSSYQQAKNGTDSKQPESQIKVNLTVEKDLSTQFTSSNQQAKNGTNSMKSDELNQNLMPKMKPLCDFSNSRSDVCEMDGDIRIHGNSSSINFLNPSTGVGPLRNESWLIKPHPRKGDTLALRKVTEMSVRSLLASDEASPCGVHHNVPALVFSTGGYMGNMFHEFTDLIIPLFITSRHYQGEVQFLISETRAWFLAKYKPYLKELSHYEIIDFNKDTRVHCYPHATVGLRSHREMTIDPLRAPNNYSMVDFARLMKKAYSLERQSAINLGAIQPKKPRLLIISRKWTRSFKNVGEIVLLAEGLGFEVVVAEANIHIAKFSQIVNSCDVMMGVHGAGLTNLVFLPTNAVVIQVVPLGGLEYIASLDFGVPSTDLKLKYLQYSITDEESTLIEMYPRDHAVFKDPRSITKQGWLALRGIYLDKQSVRLDVRRFKGYLEQALQHLHQ